MKAVIKNKGKMVKAYRLGEDHEVLKGLMEEGKIKEREDGDYEIFSLEARNGVGEIAKKGDFVKVDSNGFPYPNDVEFFLKNHKHISGDEYEQIPKPLPAWTADEPVCAAIEYLKMEKGLVIDETSEERYFTAPLWGSILSAAKDAVVIFYRIDQDNRGNITDIDYNFVAREEFEKSYTVLE